MSETRITRITIRPDVVADALQPIEDQVRRLEWGNAEKEVERLLAEHGPKKRSDE